MEDAEEKKTARFARERAWSELTENTSPEVLILGGGVNGVGLLRDLSLNGVSTVLIDTGDFCAGASGASSRMAHGGLRYLEGREFSLVRESARERNMLLHDASHLVKPLEVVVPITNVFHGFPQAALRFLGLSKKAGALSLVAIEMALMLYERFGAVRRALPRHGVALARRSFPPGLPAAVKSVVNYYDGQIVIPENLIMEMIDAAIAAPGVTAVNHVTWTYDGSGSFIVTDSQSGERAVLHPKMIVNATGSAIDRVNAALGTRTQVIRGIKGAHLVLRHDALHERMNGRAFYFDDGKGRMVICLPVQDVVLVGTTEIEASDPKDHSVSHAEITYLLGALNTLFDDLTVSESNIVSVTSGIRPLQASSGSATQAARDHALVRTEANGTPVWSLVGGKWTTFRSFAETATDAILSGLGRARRASTADRPYPGAAKLDLASLAKKTGLPTRRLEELRARYGAIASDVATFCATKPDAPIADAPSYSRREVEWLTYSRMPLTLEDMVLRRMNIVMTGRLTRAALHDIAGTMAGVLGHGPEWIETQVQNCAEDDRILWHGGKS
ncbi:glycerol-3-phosphate dehydrogenase/oxidase [Gluconobacter oxydans]|uniref:glycerol-3-phosphate dehydrogenase/oxidase n=1 Tax=Gluconobacter oxydans TaxID=442 RepID=UPI0039EBE961